MSQKYTSGYCSNCCKNVPHLRWVSNPFARILDVISLRVLRIFRIGPWYCVHCDRNVVALARPNPNAPQYHSAALDREYPVQEIPPGFRPPETSSCQLVTSQANFEVNHDNEQNAISVGNYLRSDSSLLMKTSRLNRFSAKYRDAVVRRILAGTTTFAFVREEKQLTEAELTEWIADLFKRQQKRIKTLEYAIRSIPSLDPLSDTVDSMMDESHTYPKQQPPS